MFFLLLPTVLILIFPFLISKGDVAGAKKGGTCEPTVSRRIPEAALSDATNGHVLFYTRRSPAKNSKDSSNKYKNDIPNL